MPYSGMHSGMHEFLPAYRSSLPFGASSCFSGTRQSFLSFSAIFLNNCFSFLGKNFYFEFLILEGSEKSVTGMDLDFKVNCFVCPRIPYLLALDTVSPRF